MCTAGQRVSLTITGPGPSFYLCGVPNVVVVLVAILYEHGKCLLLENHNL